MDGLKPIPAEVSSLRDWWGIYVNGGPFNLAPSGRHFSSTGIYPGVNGQKAIFIKAPSGRHLLAQGFNPVGPASPNNMPPMGWVAHIVGFV